MCISRVLGHTQKALSGGTSRTTACPIGALTQARNPKLLVEWGCTSLFLCNSSSGRILGCQYSCKFMTCSRHLPSLHLGLSCGPFARMVTLPFFECGRDIVGVFSSFGEKISPSTLGKHVRSLGQLVPPEKTSVCSLFNNRVGTRQNNFQALLAPTMSPSIFVRTFPKCDGETETQSPLEFGATLQHGDPVKEHFTQIHQIQLRPGLRCDLKMPCPHKNWRDNSGNLTPPPPLVFCTK